MARARKTREPRDGHSDADDAEDDGVEGVTVGATEGVAVGATEGNDVENGDAESPTPEAASKDSPPEGGAFDEPAEHLGIEAPLISEAETAEGIGVSSAGFGGFAAGVFADAPREESAEGTPDKRKRERKASASSGDKITPDQRAKVAVIGGEIVGGGLDFLSGFFGSKLTVEGFSERMNDRFAGRMKARGIDLPLGLPIDLREPGPNELPIVQTLSVVMRFGGGQYVPVRFASGQSKLTKEETPAKNPKEPAEGEHVLVEIPANAAHAIMYNLAAKPHEFVMNLLAWLKNNEESLRLGYAGLLVTAFMWQALNTKEK